MESHRRSIAKSLTWRLIAFATTIIVVYIYSRDMKESLIVGFFANFIKMFLYYVHERVWLKFNYGKIKKVDYQI